MKPLDEVTIKQYEKVTRECGSALPGWILDLCEQAREANRLRAENAAVASTWNKIRRSLLDFLEADFPLECSTRNIRNLGELVGSWVG